MEISSLRKTHEVAPEGFSSLETPMHADSCGAWLGLSTRPVGRDRTEAVVYTLTLQASL